MFTNEELKKRLELANAGDADMQFNIAYLLQNGYYSDFFSEYNMGDPSDLYKEAAENGHAGACYELGKIHFDRWKASSRKDFLIRAEKWLTRALMNDYQGGDSYLFDLITSSDEEENKKIINRLEEQADNGDIEAMFKLGIKYYHPLCNKDRDIEKALRYFKECFDKGVIGADYYIDVIESELLEF